ncbi:MAG: hypothetical protein JJK56_24340 [Pseudomonas sp.]|jgi:hypothetical protein|uniref:hypothetical protein n=1 Tax=Pseudomonas sp. TaxID=306 RepID=UPI001A639584|nr:hypothetical protein [Pseudomonas sp.]MBL7231100.1 hypothetical protein [Pseudomonas sp.]
MNVYSTSEFYDDVQSLGPDERSKVMRLFDKASSLTMRQLLDGGDLKPLNISGENLHVLSAGGVKIYCVLGREDQRGGDADLVLIRLESAKSPSGSGAGRDIAAGRRMR